jgi:hypothetical protein
MGEGDPRSKHQARLKRTRAHDDAEVSRLRELSMDYSREAERIENEGVTRVESSEQISAGLDAIARYFFARALRNAK